MTAEMWRLVDGRGGVREVPVRVEGGLLLVGRGPQPRYFASEEPPRLALMHYAMSMRWPIAEILAPGESTRSEALVDRQHFRDLLAVIHRDGGHYLAQHGVERACGDAMHRVLADREELALAEREHVAAERARCAAVCREAAENYSIDGAASRAAAATECAEAIERGAVAA